MIHSTKSTGYPVFHGIFRLGLAAALLLCLALPPELAAAPRVALVLGGMPGDRAFNDLATAGLRRAEKELDINAEVIWLSESPNSEAAMSHILRAGYDLLITEDVGARASGLAGQLRQYPRQKVAHIDGWLEAPGVLHMRFAAQEAAFLAGAAAALLARAPDMPGMRGRRTLGFVGGARVPGIENYLVAFEAGARHVEPDVRVLASFTGTFNNVRAGQGLARLHYLNGADVVMHAAGRTGLGVLRAAGQEKFYAIGADADQDAVAPGHVFASTLKRVDKAVYEAVRRLTARTFAPGVAEFNLANDGVGLTDVTALRARYGAAFPADMGDRVARLTEDVRSGRVRPPTAQGLPQSMASTAQAAGADKISGNATASAARVGAGKISGNAASPSAASTPAGASSPGQGLQAFMARQSAASGPSVNEVLRDMTPRLAALDPGAMMRQYFAALAAMRSRGQLPSEAWDTPEMSLYCKDQRQLALLGGMYEADFLMDVASGSTVKHKGLLAVADAVPEPLLAEYLRGLAQLGSQSQSQAATGGPAPRERSEALAASFLNLCDRYYRVWGEQALTPRGLPMYMDVLCGFIMQDIYVALQMILAEGAFGDLSPQLGGTRQRLEQLTWMLESIWVQPELRRRVGAVWFRTVLLPLFNFMQEKQGQLYTVDDVRYMLLLVDDVRAETIAPCR